MPVFPKPYSYECRVAQRELSTVSNIKQTIQGETGHTKPTAGVNARIKSTEIDGDKEGVFWFLEVARSSSPVGLILQRIHANIFVRVELFALHRGIDPTTTNVSGIGGVRGARSWDWSGMLELRRICLVYNSAAGLGFLYGRAPLRETQPVSMSFMNFSSRTNLER